MKSFFFRAALLPLLCMFFTIAGAQRKAAVFLPVTRSGERYLAALPDSLLGRDLLAVTRVAKGYSDSLQAVLAGEKANEQLVRFVREGNRILLLAVTSNLHTAGISSSLAGATANSAQDPVACVFEVDTSHGAPYMIDITALLASENEFVFMSHASKENWGLTTYQPENAAVLGVRSFSNNVFISSRKTYSRRSGNPVTVELGTTLLLLSKEPMHPRVSDGRVGFFTTPGLIDFDSDPGGSKKMKWITRWRLEPKPEDIERYNRGELVEPKKPIVFYIDPATPARWVPFFIKAVDDWQPAFEKAGFKNAIYARPAPTPEEDSAWSLSSAAYSNIVYMASDNEDASYSTVVDPRSGEIVESHIRWYHDVLKVLRSWYFVQASPSDARARKVDLDDALMGELVRYIMSHEIGHALGFPHNFIASSNTPVALLRDKGWVEAHGHTVSIMDYARFNYVAQPEDRIGPRGLFPRIGEYDKWAIEWGYRWLPPELKEKGEQLLLHRWIAGKMKDPHYWYGGEGGNDDPRAQSEDLGDDVVEANRYGVRNLKYIMAHLQEWTQAENTAVLKLRYDGVFYQFSDYLGHVADNIGGIYESPQPGLEEGILYRAVPRNIQQKALAFLNEQLFVTPSWLLDREIFSKTGYNAIGKLNELQSKILYALMSAKRIGNLVKAAAADSLQAFSPREYFEALNKLIFREASTHGPTDPYRRNLQNVYVDFLERLQKLPPVARLLNPEQGDIPVLVRNAMTHLKAMLDANMDGIKEEMTKTHLSRVIARLDNLLSQPVK